MRVLALFFLAFGHVTYAQTQLTGVKVNIESLENRFEISAVYEIDVPNETEELNLKALTFGGARIIQIEMERLEPTTSQGYELTSIHIPLPKGLKPEKITLHYQVVPGDKGEIPIFFGDWQSASSDQDFFQVHLNTNMGTNLLFPADSESDTSGDSKVIRASLPASTSMIRVEERSDAGSAWIRRVDQMVIIIFILIGALIWFNRKRLIYG